MLKTAAVTVTEPLMLAGVVTPPPEMLAGMVTAWPAVAVTVPITTMGGKLDPGLRESPRVQVNPPAGVPRVQVQPDPETEVIVKPVGGSVTVVVPLVLPPLAALDTVIEYVASV
jgi:hypothetical protein